VSVNNRHVSGDNKQVPGVM